MLFFPICKRHFLTLLWLISAQVGILFHYNLYESNSQSTLFDILCSVNTETGMIWADDIKDAGKDFPNNAENNFFFYFQTSYIVEITENYKSA